MADVAQIDSTHPAMEPQRGFGTLLRPSPVRRHTWPVGRWYALGGDREDGRRNPNIKAGALKELKGASANILFALTEVIRTQKAHRPMPPSVILAFFLQKNWLVCTRLLAPI